METQLASLPSWLDVIPFDTNYAKLAGPETPIFVDVGGGNGQQCDALYKRYPTLKGRIVLQDRPEVLETAITSSCVERMPYNYFMEQPVKGTPIRSCPKSLHKSTNSPKVPVYTISARSSIITTTKHATVSFYLIYRQWKMIQ